MKELLTLRLNGMWWRIHHIFSLRKTWTRDVPRLIRVGNRRRLGIVILLGVTVFHIPIGIL